MFPSTFPDLSNEASDTLSQNNLSSVNDVCQTFSCNDRKGNQCIMAADMGGSACKQLGPLCTTCGEQCIMVGAYPPHSLEQEVMLL